MKFPAMTKLTLSLVILLALSVFGCSSTPSDSSGSSLSDLLEDSEDNWQEDLKESLARADVDFQIPADASISDIRSDLAKAISGEALAVDQAFESNGVDPKNTSPICAQAHGIPDRMMLLEDKNPSVSDSHDLINGALADLRYYKEDLESSRSGGVSLFSDPSGCANMTEDLLSLYPDLAN